MTLKHGFGGISYQTNLSGMKYSNAAMGRKKSPS